MRYKPKIFWSSLLLALLCAASAYAESPTVPTPSPSPEPVVEVKVPKSYRVKKYSLLPLEIPAYVFKGVTWPLLELGKFLERHPRLFTFEERDWLLLPVVDFGGADGWGGGIYFQYNNLFKEGYQLRLDYRINGNLDQRGTLDLDSPIFYLWDRPTAYGILTYFRNNPNARFYGIGPASQQADRAEYGVDRVQGGAEWEYYLLPQFKFTLPVEWMTADTRPGPADEPSVQDSFPPSQLPGFEQRLTYFITGLTLTHDTSDSELTPTRGGVRSFQFLRFQGLGTTDFDFNQYLLDIRQYVPLWSERHVLALRNAWQFQQPTGGSQVPFYLLSQLDWKTLLRGFDRGRFRDTAYVIFNFEYRFPIWDYVNGTIFVDTGKVFPGIKNFSFADWKYSVGGGFNFFMRNLFLLNLQVGYGGEGVEVIFQVGPSI